mgnify:CR=1 FL=1
MSLKVILESWGPAITTPAIIVLMTLVEIAPIKVNPWSALVRFLSRNLNADVTDRLDAMQKCLEEVQEKLNEHISSDDDRNARSWRTQILRFNDELVHGVRHTKEHFDEMLGIIHDYETYCTTHKNFPNGQCVHAIANINRVYDELLESHDFL